MAPQRNDAAAWVSIFRRHMDDMLNIVYHMRQNCNNLHEFSPLMDIYETAEHFVIEIDLPGFAEPDFTVTTDGQAVRIDGVKHHAKAETAMSYICLERHFGRFSRTVEVPAGFAPERLAAEYQRGVLAIKVPRP